MNTLGWQLLVMYKQGYPWYKVKNLEKAQIFYYEVINEQRFQYNNNNNNNNSRAAQLRVNNIIQFNGIAKTRYYLTIEYRNP